MGTLAEQEGFRARAPSVFAGGRHAGAPAVTLSRRRALACGGAMLLTHVGIAHEVVGATLYPDGPARVGGLLAWNAIGFGGVALGVVLICGALRLVRLPMVALGIVVSAIGAGFVASDAIADHHFHFFAFTMVIAGALVAIGGREPAERSDGGR